MTPDAAFHQDLHCLLKLKKCQGQKYIKIQKFQTASQNGQNHAYCINMNRKIRKYKGHLLLMDSNLPGSIQYNISIILDTAIVQFDRESHIKVKGWDLDNSAVLLFLIYCWPHRLGFHVWSLFCSAFFSVISSVAELLLL